MRRGWSGKRGEGQAIKWLLAHVSHTGEGCLIWPFARMAGGYGQFGYNGKHHYAHRYMCKLAHGKPPTRKHHAAHSCGKGHDGCVHPDHLSWKTCRENLLDRQQHGTVRHGCRWTPKLTPDQVSQIRALKGSKTQQEIANIFGVARSCIRYWHSHDNQMTGRRSAEWLKIQAVFKKSKKPLRSADVVKATGMRPINVPGMLSKMVRDGAIKRVSHGTYQFLRAVR